jgi:hypothetical protein
VLGSLYAVYRSPESTALYDPEGHGVSCTWFTKRHHALVVTPTRNDGKTLFGMAKGVGGMIGSIIAGGRAPPASETGPWDDMAEGSNGSLYFLKGDSMLEVIYRTSSTDRKGALELARHAVERL